MSGHGPECEELTASMQRAAVELARSAVMLAEAAGAYEEAVRGARAVKAHELASAVAAQAATLRRTARACRECLDTVLH